MAWYVEKSEYDRNPEPVNLDTKNYLIWGHYSQMVWSSTQRVGCGQAASTGFPGKVQKAVNAWAGNANMRNCAFKETGLAVARSNAGKFYWTQTFGG